MSTLGNSTEDWNPDSWIKASLLPGLGMKLAPGCAPVKETWWEKVTGWLCKERHIFKPRRWEKVTGWLCKERHIFKPRSCNCEACRPWGSGGMFNQRLVATNGQAERNFHNDWRDNPCAEAWAGMDSNTTDLQRRHFALAAYQSGSISVDELRRTFALDGRPNEGNVLEIIRETEERRLREREREWLMMQQLNVSASRSMFSASELERLRIPTRPQRRGDGQLDAFAMGVYMTESAAAVAQALDAQHTRELQEVKAEVQVEQVEQAEQAVSPDPDELALDVSAVAEVEAAASEAYDTLLEGG